LPPSIIHAPVEQRDPMTNGLPDGDHFASILRCPACGSSLDPARPSMDDVDRLSCPGCGLRWPVRFGIPDLRGPGVVDPYLSRDDDLRAADRLFERAAHGSFEDALASYYETNERVTADQARRFIAGSVASEGRARAVFDAWRSLTGEAIATRGLTRH
jgi:uncharacterized protein YbaR (Trm112 family)